jgi:hypothetical protein
MKCRLAGSLRGRTYTKGNLGNRAMIDTAGTFFVKEVDERRKSILRTTV